MGPIPQHTEVDAGEAPTVEACGYHTHGIHHAILLTLGLVLVATTWRGSLGVTAPPPAADLQEKIDPNAAPWWELTVLPGVGETLARRIVEHRELMLASPSGISQPAFNAVHDLQDVRGIGPVKCRRIGPNLRFPERASP